MFPLVSIVIPHFERPGLLAGAVTSIRASGGVAYEIVVVDDGSSEAAWMEVKSMEAGDLRVFRRVDGTKGPSRCRNIGLAMARGEYVIFLDSDDLMAPWCLGQRLMEVEKEPSRDLWVFPVMLFCRQPWDMDVLWNAMADERNDAVRFAGSDPPWHTSSPVWRKAPLLLLGGFNEAVFYGDDSDLHLRALVCGLEVGKYPDAIPDLFVRRSDVPRITNSMTDSLTSSRMERLREGTRFLRSQPGCGTLMKVWEGQYFSEAEFLLYNHASPKVAVRNVLNEWVKQFHPPLTRKLVVQGYFHVAVFFRRRAYLILRIARRLALRLLPPEFFPAGGQFQSARLSDQVKARIPVVDIRWGAGLGPTIPVISTPTT